MPGQGAGGRGLGAGGSKQTMMVRRNMSYAQDVVWDAGYQWLLHHTFLCSHFLTSQTSQFGCQEEKLPSLSTAHHWASPLPPPARAFPLLLMVLFTLILLLLVATACHAVVDVHVSRPTPWYSIHIFHYLMHLEEFIDSVVATGCHMCMLCITSDCSCLSNMCTS